jgi:hypothetical protein
MGCPICRRTVPRFGTLSSDRPSSSLFLALLEATASKQPARAFALQTLVIAIVTCSFARRAFEPIVLTDCALIYSRASMRARHARALPVGKENVMAGRSTACTNCDWFRALHTAEYSFYHLNRFDGWLSFYLTCGPSGGTQPYQPPAAPYQNVWNVKSGRPRRKSMLWFISFTGSQPRNSKF